MLIRLLTPEMSRLPQLIRLLFINCEFAGGHNWPFALPHRISCEKAEQPLVGCELLCPRGKLRWWGLSPLVGAASTLCDVAKNVGSAQKLRCLAGIGSVDPYWHHRDVSRWVPLSLLSPILNLHNLSWWALMTKCKIWKLLRFSSSTRCFRRNSQLKLFAKICLLVVPASL